MSLIQNPILRGFNADPSIIRVEDTYYIANSTFEWFPGVRLHESKDLKNWNLLPSPLSTTTLLDMKGNPSSGGIWAPALSWADGQFWLVYTDVKVTEGAFKDMTNYLTTAKDIRGPWSDPIKLNGVGFDASLFHDDDGRKYIVQQTWGSPGVPSPLRWHYLNGAGYQDAEVNAGNRAHHLPRHRRGAGRGAAPL